QVVLIAPYDAIRAVRSYRTVPWGPQFFAEVVLREPRWVVSALTYSPAQHAAVRHALDTATHPAVQALAELARSSYPAKTKARMAVFVEELATQTLSFEETAHLSSDAQTYFRRLVALYL